MRCEEENQGVLEIQTADWPTGCAFVVAEKMEFGGLSLKPGDEIRLAEVKPGAFVFHVTFDISDLIHTFGEEPFTGKDIGRTVTVPTADMPKKMALLEKASSPFGQETFSIKGLLLEYLARATRFRTRQGLRELYNELAERTYSEQALPAYLKSGVHDAFMEFMVGRIALEQARRRIEALLALPVERIQ